MNSAVSALQRKRWAYERKGSGNRNSDSAWRPQPDSRELAASLPPPLGPLYTLRGRGKGKGAEGARPSWRCSKTEIERSPGKPIFLHLNSTTNCMNKLLNPEAEAIISSKGLAFKDTKENPSNTGVPSGNSHLPVRRPGRAVGSSCALLQGRNQDAGTQTRLQSQWPRANYASFLGLGFLICKMGILTISV